MKKSKFTESQITGALKEYEAGKNVLDICRELDKPLILADSVGLRSKKAMLFLLSMGFKNIANLPGGIVEWERDGLPPITNKSEQLDGSCMC